MGFIAGCRHPIRDLPLASNPTCLPDNARGIDSITIQSSTPKSITIPEAGSPLYASLACNLDVGTGAHNMYERTNSLDQMTSIP
jgi:hypothetical protein